MNILKQSTAATIKLGPFVDDTDGKTAETALTIGQADIRLSKNGGDIAQSHNSAGATHDELGYYDIPLDTTDTGTLGRLRVLVSKAGALPVWQDFLIVTANVFDTFCSTDSLDVNVTSLADDVITAGKFDESTAYPLKSADTGATAVARVGADSDTLETLSDEIAAVKAETAAILVDTGTDGVVLANDAITAAKFDESTAFPIKSADAGSTQIARAGNGGYDLTEINDMLITDGVAVRSIADNAITADAVKADAVTKIQSGLATSAALTTVDANVDSILADTGTDGVKIANTQGAITWGQQKIVANVAYEGALDIRNSNANGTGSRNWGTKFGLVNLATGASSFGQVNESQGASGTGMFNNASGTTSKGLVNNGTAQDVDGYDPALALEATLTAIKGAGWTTQTLSDIATAIYNLDTLINQLRTQDGYNLDDVLNAIAAISAGSGATAQEVWEYATRLLTAGTNIDLSSLATASDLTILVDKVDTVDGILDDLHDTDIPAIKAETAAIKAKTDLIPASPAEAGEYTAAIAAVKSVADDILVDTGTTLDALIKDIPTNAELATALGTVDDAVLAAVAAAKTVIDNIHDTDLPAVKAETAMIVEDTGTTIPATLATLAGYTDGIAGDVWSHATRTLTVPAVAMSDPEDGTTLKLYKDADINIEFTGLTIPTGAKKVVFTIKDNLDDADTAAALQATYQLTAVPAETHTLNYINSATPPTLTNPVTFTVTTDSVEFDMTAAAAYYLPRYERGYLKWDLKLITATTVQILQQGLVQILGTSTRTVA